MKSKILLAIITVMTIIISMGVAGDQTVNDEENTAAAPDTGFNGAALSDTDDLTTGGWTKTINNGGLFQYQANAPVWDPESQGNTLAAVLRYNAGADTSQVRYTNSSLNAEWASAFVRKNAASANNIWALGNLAFAVRSAAPCSSQTNVCLCCGDTWAPSDCELGPAWLNDAWVNITVHQLANGTQVGYFDNSTTISKHCAGTTLNTATMQTQANLDLMEMTDIRFYNDTIPAPPASENPINVTIDQPPYWGYGFGLDYFDTAGNADIWINGSHNDSALATVTINSTDFTDMGSNDAMGFNFTFKNNTALTDGFYMLQVSVNLTGTSNGTNETYFLLDRVSPVIDTDFSANQKYNYVPDWDNITGSINASDDHLYSLKVNDTYSTIFEITNIPATTYSYNFTYNFTNYTIGKHNLTVTIFDGHTGKDIPDYPFTLNPALKSIKFEFDKLYKNSYVTVRLIGLGVFDDFDATKADTNDRYEFTYTPNPLLPMPNSVEIEVQSSHFIDIISKAGYNGWMVVPDLSKWIDFEIKGATGKEIYTVTRISDKKVRVLITNMDIDSQVTFHSIGEMNQYQETYFWYQVNATDASTAGPFIEQTTAHYSLIMEKNTSVITTDATLLYNGTLQTVTKTSYGNSDTYFAAITNIEIDAWNETGIPINWTYNFTLGGNTFGGTINRTAEVYKMVAGLCNGSLQNVTTINYTVSDADTEIGIEGYNFEGLYTIWTTNNTAFLRTYSFQNASASNYTQICLYPWFMSTYQSNIQNIFTRSGYQDTSYDQNGFSLTQTMQTIPISMQNTSLATQVTITLVDENDLELEGYIIHTYRYNLGTNDYTLIDSSTTNSEGDIQVYLVSTEEYKFEVEDEFGAIIHIEPKQTIIGTTYTLQIVIGTEVEDITNILRSLSIEAGGHRDTKEVNVSWQDVEYAVEEVTFVVVKKNATNSTSIYQTSSTSGAGLESYTVTDDTSNVDMDYIGQVYVRLASDNETYFVDSYTLVYKKAFQIFGSDSVFVSFIIVAAIAAIGIYVSAEVGLILALLSLIVTNALGLFYTTMGSLFSIAIVIVVLLVRLQRR